MRRGRIPIILTVGLLAASAGVVCWMVFPRDGSSARGAAGARLAGPASDVSEHLIGESKTTLIVPAAESRETVHEAGPLPLAQPAPASPIPQFIRGIVDRTIPLGASSRLSAVHALTDRLDVRERAALHAFLIDPNRPEDLSAKQHYLLANEIMKELRRQRDNDPALGAVLVAIYRDGRQELVVRDYALQHLGEWGLANGLDKESELVFREALLEKGSSIAGTALIALNKLAGETRKLSVSMVENAALSLASDESANEGARATAIAICSIRGVVDALPVTRESVSKSSVLLRLASIAYVGNYGQEEDQRWLAEIMTDAPGIVVASAETAIQRIAARNDEEPLIMQYEGEL